MRDLDSLVFAGLLVAALLNTPAAALDASQRMCQAPYSPQEKLIQKHVAAANVAVPDFSQIPTAPVPAALTGSIRRVELPAGLKLVALTFDLCETPNEVAGYDGAIFETLRQAHIPATLFAGGHWSETHEARFGEIATAAQFEIGNHTWTHANLRTVDAATLKREVYAPIAAFAEVAGRSQCVSPDAPSAARPTLFRFPFGACNPASMREVNDAGMLAIQWDVSADDASPFRSADMIVRDTLAAVRPGSIILAHANGRGYHTGDALPRIIAGLKARGYAFVTVSQLLAAGKPVIAASCYDFKPGDTDKYDSWGKHTVAPLPPPQAPGAPQALQPKPIKATPGAVPAAIN
jgi:peptidoglycan/xylan/chitin deacetylase (PgdA/CDA1 family)